jgi:integrase
MENKKARITKRSVDGVEVPPKGQEARLWDTDINGFFVRVYPTGRRVYALKYRLGPKQRIFTIGVHGSPHTPETARDAADAALRRVADGEDPAVAKKEAREALTVAELIDRYLEDGPATKPGKRESTWAIDGSNLNRHVRPLLGRKVANNVTKAEAARAVQDITAGKTAKVEKSKKARGKAIVKGGAGTARRTRTTAAAMFAWGIEHGLVKANPFAAVKLAAAPVRERFLSQDEASRLFEVLANMEAAGDIRGAVADAIRLLLLTGARKTEVAALQWGEVDFDRRRLVLPPLRTKAGGKTGERRIVLSDAALELLKARRPEKAKADAFVFPAARGDGPVVGIRKPFLEACTSAEIESFRVHDLRHSFASFLIADGASLFLVGKLLGHAGTRATERYAHLSGDPLEDAATALGKKLVPAKKKDGDEGGEGEKGDGEQAAVS